MSFVFVGVLVTLSVLAGLAYGAVRLYRYYLK